MPHQKLIIISECYFRVTALRGINWVDTPSVAQPPRLIPTHEVEFSICSSIWAKVLAIHLKIPHEAATPWRGLICLYVMYTLIRVPRNYIIWATSYVFLLYLKSQGERAMLNNLWHDYHHAHWIDSYKHSIYKYNKRKMAIYTSVHKG